jgi:epoxide hydrolase
VEDDVHPFRIAVPDAVLDDLRTRLRATRWPERETVAVSTFSVAMTLC